MITEQVLQYNPHDLVLQYNPRTTPNPADLQKSGYISRRSRASNHPRRDRIRRLGCDPALLLELGTRIEGVGMDGSVERVLELRGGARRGRYLTRRWRTGRNKGGACRTGWMARGRGGEGQAHARRSWEGEGRDIWVPQVRNPSPNLGDIGLGWRIRITHESRLVLPLPIGS